MNVTPHSVYWALVCPMTVNAITVFEVRTHDASDGWATTVFPWPPGHAGRISRQHLQECKYLV